MTTFEMSEIGPLLKVMKNIADKLSLIMPMYVNIEQRLMKIENDISTNTTISMSSDQSSQSSGSEDVLCDKVMAHIDSTMQHCNIG